MQTVVFGHHPCPDGIAALVCLARKFGTENATYYGLNHAKPSEMHAQIFSAVSSRATSIIFADIAPPWEILQELLEKTSCTITLLDHHATAKLAIDSNAHYLSKFINCEPARLQLYLDLARSGAGIAYDYAFGEMVRPIYISLVQTIDLLTATSDPEVIKQFDVTRINIDSRFEQLFSYLRLLTDSYQIKNNIEFYVAAALFDLQMKRFFSANNNAMNSKLMADVKSYFERIEKHGFSALLQTNNQEITCDIKTLFIEQLEYQASAIAKAQVIPSLIDNELDILFIDADIQNGRTFDVLIAQKLASFSRPTIAMVVDCQHVSEVNNWIAIRAANNLVNLYAIAEKYKLRNLVTNAGGHSRAAALQLTSTQFSVFYNLFNKQKAKSYLNLSVFATRMQPSTYCDGFEIKNYITPS